ncbi:MAG: methyltransferase domain-containing protein [Desulfobacteraceae bacterium]|nr:methyltransferase domain-containing protein [Desulfobacteraceae bacterium]
MAEKQQLNEIVEPFLAQYQCGDFMLDTEGCKRVYDANENLDESYAKEHTTPISRYSYKRFKKFILSVPPKEYGTALDVCCGTGQLCLNIMKYNLFDECYAIDISRPSGELLAKRMQQEGIEGIIPMEGNVIDSRFEDRFFDCVMGHFFLHHLPDNQAFFREMFRILKPGGVICLPGEPGVAADFFEPFLTNKLIRLRSLFKRGVRNVKSETGNQPTTEPIFSDIWVYNEQDFRKTLRDIGFTEIQITSRGRIQSMANHLVGYIWYQIFQQAPPASISIVMTVFYLLDKILFFAYPVDAFSYFHISARKPFCIE